jgi:hypothetical protein
MASIAHVSDRDLSLFADGRATVLGNHHCQWTWNELSSKNLHRVETFIASSVMFGASLWGTTAPNTVLLFSFPQQAW